MASNKDNDKDPRGPAPSMQHCYNYELQRWVHRSEPIYYTNSDGIKLKYVADKGNLRIQNKGIENSSTKRRSNESEDNDFLKFATPFIQATGLLGSGVNTGEATSYVKKMWEEVKAERGARAGKKKRGKKKKKKGKARITSISMHAGPPPPGLTKFSPEEVEKQKAMMMRLFQVCDSCGKSTFNKLKKCPCGSVRYCDKKCQRKHWEKHGPKHKQICACVKIQAMVRGWLVRRELRAHNNHVSHGKEGNFYKHPQMTDISASKGNEQMSCVPLEFAQLLEEKLQDLPDVSQTLCVSVLQKGREALPEDQHNHIDFLVSQDPNFDHQDIGCCPYGKTPIMVDWEKPWYLIHIYDWTCNGDPPRLCDPKTEEYPKRYCPLHMDAKLLKQFYAEFDCGIGVNMKERFQLDFYEWNSEPRGYDADCRLVRVSEKKRSAPTLNAESQCKKQKVDEDGRLKHLKSKKRKVDEVTKKETKLTFEQWCEIDPKRYVHYRRWGDKTLMTFDEYFSEGLTTIPKDTKQIQLAHEARKNLGISEDIFKDYWLEEESEEEDEGGF